MMYGSVKHCFCHHHVHNFVVKAWCETGTPERGALRGHCTPCPLRGGAAGAQVPLRTSIISNFMICEDQFETSLLQLFAHT